MDLSLCENCMEIGCTVSRYNYLKASLWAGSGRSYSVFFFDKLWKNPLHSLITFVMYNRLFDDRGHKTKVEIETGSQWIMVALNKVKVCLKF